MTTAAHSRTRLRFSGRPQTAGLETIDWLIVGGGIHGVHIAARLLGEAGVDPEQLRIVDPEPELLARWRACTAATGMSFLRSPAVHHLDVDPWSLQRFAGPRKGRSRQLFTQPYDRPALTLFDSHCQHVIDTYRLADLHIQAAVSSCSIERNGAVARLRDQREMVARQIVLALGAGDRILRPSWAPSHDPRVRHIFEADFNGWRSLAPCTVAVVGGGISATQAALRLSGEGHEVHQISRHYLRQHQFDSDSGWLGPKHMRGFQRLRCPNQRRKTIDQARHRGSVPSDVRRSIRRAIEQGEVHWHLARVDEVERHGDNLSLSLSSAELLRVDRILLATGTSAERPGGPLVANLIESEDLPCAECGYPILDSTLRWHPRIFVSGPLAELELGPAARNIAGARRAAERLVKFALSSTASRHGNERKKDETGRGKRPVDRGSRISPTLIHHDEPVSTRG